MMDGKPLTPAEARQFMETWAVEKYDEIVTRAGDAGIRVDETRDIFAQEYVVAVMSGEIPPECRPCVVDLRHGVRVEQFLDELDGAE
jgi:hypothetical protein